MGDQEYDIVKSVSNMTKYATMIEDPKDIRYALEKAWHLATTGRPGDVYKRQVMDHVISSVVNI